MSRLRDPNEKPVSRTHHEAAFGATPRLDTPRCGWTWTDVDVSTFSRNGEGRYRSVRGAGPSAETFDSANGRLRCLKKQA